MRHLIVVAHPAEDSFTMALARAYAAEVEKLGHSHRMHDLYRLDFDPVLAAHELAPAPNQAASSDVAWAQEDMRAADVLCVVYPLWWLAMPAMMKGYIDRVFAQGFAFDLVDEQVQGLLAGKRAILITLSGASLPVLQQDGGWGALQLLQDSHVFRATGFEILEHLHCDAITPTLAQSIAQEHLARVAACVQRHFGAS
ncbi:MAG TPA: NAD(P)H-dependent oxidoreductase [Burkholderiaceae bacterium]|nr:NAD(P)H-dependent oxidoreductase [Burkholderiaceae bacterium]